MQAHMFESIGLATQFILAGNARFTLVSQKTGARFTYRVSRKADAPESAPWFVALLSGPNNEGDYCYLGTIFPPKGNQTAPVYVHGRKSRVSSSAPSVRAFAWAWAFLAKGEAPPSCEVWHEGRCGKCGRALTVPESVASGIGPVCGEAA